MNDRSEPPLTLVSLLVDSFVSLSPFLSLYIYIYIYIYVQTRCAEREREGEEHEWTEGESNRCGVCNFALSLSLSLSFSPWLRTIRCIRRRAHYKTGEYKRQRWVETDPPTWSSTEQASSSSHPAGNLLSSYFNISRNSANTAVFPILLFLLFLLFLFFRFVSIPFLRFCFFFPLFPLLSVFRLVEIRSCCVISRWRCLRAVIKNLLKNQRHVSLSVSENVETAARLHLVSFFFQRSSKLQLQRFRSGCFCHVFFELQILRADIFILGGGEDWSYVWILFFTVSERDGHRRRQLSLLVLKFGLAR